MQVLHIRLFIIGAVMKRLQGPDVGANVRDSLRQKFPRPIITLEICCAHRSRWWRPAPARRGYGPPRGPPVARGTRIWSLCRRHPWPAGVPPGAMPCSTPAHHARPALSPARQRHETMISSNLNCYILLSVHFETCVYGKTVHLCTQGTHRGTHRHWKCVSG